MNTEFKQMYDALNMNDDLSYTDFLEKRLSMAIENIKLLLEEQRWISWPEHEPVQGESYWVLQKYPDGWNYQIATYSKFRGDVGWFSEILAVPLRYVTHYMKLVPPPNMPK